MRKEVSVLCSRVLSLSVRGFFRAREIMASSSSAVLLRPEEADGPFAFGIAGKKAYLFTYDKLS